MQLIRLKLLSEFRSLSPDFEIKFSQEPVPAELDQLISPICLVGKNGTGKSNTLELLCEIFFYLDSLLLNYPSESLLAKKQFGFELEYKFNVVEGETYETWIDKKFQWSNTERHVKVVKSPNEEGPVYYLVDSNEQPSAVQRTKDTLREVKEKVKKLLPNKVIGYSSGLNELISNPFLKMQFHYFHEYQKRLEEYVLDGFEDGSLFFMNYESNAAVVVANFLMQHEKKLAVLDDTLEISGLESFRIVIEQGNFFDVDSDARANEEKVDILTYFTKEIQFLKQISTTQKETTYTDNSTTEQKKVLTLDYKITSATKAAFRHFFGDTYTLYSIFHRMHLLNIYKIPEEKRTRILNAFSGMNISDILPTLSADQLLFRIEKIKLIKSKTNKIVHYKNISDGEHQFMHIVGTSMIMNQNKTIFILDEPETHFNPKWRSKYVNTINKVEKAEVLVMQENNQERVKNPVEMVLTTHSPFILSDSYRNKIWKFSKENGQLVHDLIGINTYGTSFSILLEDAFDKMETISEMSFEFIESLKRDLVSIQDIESAQDQLRLLGDSTEKIFLLNYLVEKRRKIENAN